MSNSEFTAWLLLALLLFFGAVSLFLFFSTGGEAVMEPGEIEIEGNVIEYESYSCRANVIDLHSARLNSVAVGTLRSPFSCKMFDSVMEWSRMDEASGSGKGD